MKKDQKILNLAENCSTIINELIKEKNIKEKDVLLADLSNDLEKTRLKKITENEKRKSESNMDPDEVIKMEKELKSFLKLQQEKNLFNVSNFIKFQLKNKRRSETLNKFILRFQFTYKWCERIYYKKIIDREKVTSKIFVELDLYLQLKRTISSNENNGLVSISNMLDDVNENIIIQGGPGFGKTTISQHVTYEILRQEKDWTTGFTFPIVIRFRDLDYSFLNREYGYGLFSIILNYFGVRLKIDVERKGDYENFAGEILIRIVEENNCFLILDGFDEIPDLHELNSFLINMNLLSAKIKRGRLLLTSRTGIISSFLENSRTYEIAPMNEPQVELFIQRWFNDKNLSDKLYKEITTGQYRNLINRPLNLASLCALYERVRELPKKPRELNKRLIDLLLKDWDYERDISRPSTYLDFPYERKIDFLRNIAFLLTVKYKKTVFTLNDIRSCYEQIYDLFELPPSEVQDVINEIESHSGLFVQGGFNTYEFAHKSFQEFLVGEYITKAMFLEINLSELFKIPNEVAIAVAISYNPHAFIATLFIQKMGIFNFDVDFTQTFLIRLVEEKPDYRSSALLAITIAFIYERMKDKPEAMKCITFMIESNRNVQLSFAELYSYYSIREVEEKIKDLRKKVNIKLENYDITVHKVFPVPFAGHMMLPEKILLNPLMLFHYFTYS